MNEYTDLSEHPWIQIMATQSRDSTLSGHKLAEVHRRMGEAVGHHVVGLIGMEDIEFQHVQGIRKGPALSRKNPIAIFPLLRAGLFAGLGIWNTIPNAAFIPISPTRGEVFPNSDIKGLPNLSGMVVVVVDAVINTGSSLEPILQWVLSQNPEQVIVCSLVTPIPTAKRLAELYPLIEWIHARVSTNQYVGKGGTDTGNRLFNTK